MHKYANYAVKDLYKDMQAANLHMNLGFSSTKAVLAFGKHATTTPQLSASIKEEQRASRVFPQGL